AAGEPPLHFDCPLMHSGSENQEAEGPRDAGRQRMGLLRCRRRRRTKIRCVQKSLWVFGSSAIHFAPYSVLTGSTTLHLSGESSWNIWIISSRVETNTRPVAGSKAVAPWPALIG